MNRAKIENAVVQIPSMGGRGVLVGDIILTAAHCVNFSTDGGMVLGDYFIEEVETRRGQRLKVTPLAVEPVADIAVLGCLDPQSCPKEADAYEHYCAATAPVPLARGRVTCRHGFPVRILNADGRWVRGKAELFDEKLPGIFIEADREIEGGASGGPILNLDGELVAIASNSSVRMPGVKSTGLCPRPLKALPQWVCEKLKRHASSSSARERLAQKRFPPTCEEALCALAEHVERLRPENKPTREQIRAARAAARAVNAFTRDLRQGSHTDLMDLE